MLNIIENDFDRIYERILINLINQPLSNSRLGLKYELDNVIFELYNPLNCLLQNSKRKYSDKIIVYEGIMNFDKTNNIKYFQWYKKFIKNKQFTNSTYGQYIADNIINVINLLKEFPNTNQAILKITYNNIITESNDFPCTIAIQFKIIKNKLNCYVQMRANDVYYGLPYDVCQFILLQQVIANELNIKIGKYTHYVTCMHLYKVDYDKVIAELNSGYTFKKFDIEFLTYKQVIDLCTEYKDRCDNE